MVDKMKTFKKILLKEIRASFNTKRSSEFSKKNKFLLIKKKRSIKKLSDEII